MTVLRNTILSTRNARIVRGLRQRATNRLSGGALNTDLFFLYADMMVISNSTVFAFNDYSMSASAHVRDLIHFHVACVQHGMSIQKIAIAQNRLRDNTRLYFCASKYEIENLSRPVYDYAGFNALKLTGVPRYDGLINDDKTDSNNSDMENAGFCTGYT